jgi:Uma2 family endonuclease
MTLAPSDPRRRYSVAEYARLEERSEVRHEWHDGDVLAMSGGTFNHAVITTNFNREVGNRLKGKPCQIVDSNMRVAAPRRMFYPDGTIVCGPPQFDPRDPSGQSLMNPRVVIEVLSPTTEKYDRNDKFLHYGAIASLEEYVLVYQDEARVESFVRQPDGTWNYDPYIGLGAVARVRSVQVEVPLVEVYAGVTLPPPPPPPLEIQTQ